MDKSKILFHNSDVSLGRQKSQEPSHFTDRSGNRELLKKRSKGYLDLIAQLDAKTLTETKGMSELMSALQEEFGTAGLTNLPIGIIAKCFLGHPYEVHTLDLGGTYIIKHFKEMEQLSAEYEKARTLALHNAYALVEVYRDKMIIILEDGSTVKL